MNIIKKMYNWFNCKGKLFILNFMSVIQTESKDKYIIAHDTVMTFGNEPLKIKFNNNPEENRELKIPAFPDLNMEIHFNEDNKPSEIKVGNNKETLIVTVNNAKTASSILGGMNEPIKIGSDKDKKEYYLNFAFSRIGSSYWFTYVIYLQK